MTVGDLQEALRVHDNVEFEVYLFEDGEYYSQDNFGFHNLAVNRCRNCIVDFFKIIDFDKAADELRIKLYVREKEM